LSGESAALFTLTSETRDTILAVIERREAGPQPRGPKTGSKP
jgi:hypothetical protein